MITAKHKKSNKKEKHTFIHEQKEPLLCSGSLGIITKKEVALSIETCFIAQNYN